MPSEPRKRNPPARCTGGALVNVLAGFAYSLFFLRLKATIPVRPAPSRSSVPGSGIAVPCRTRSVVITMLTPIPLVVRVLVLVKGIVQVAVVGDVMSIVEGDPAGAVTTVGVFEKSFRVPVEELTTKPWLTVTTVPPRSGWNGLLPFVLIDAGSFTWRTNWDNVVVPRNGMLKVATLKLPEPPMVVTFEADDVRSVLELR